MRTFSAQGSIRSDPPCRFLYPLDLYNKQLCLHCSRDCPIFYMRKKVILDLEEQDTMIRRFD